MTGNSDKGDQELYLKLLLGLLPFDVDITMAAVRDIILEADKTSWPSVMRRSANLGLVLSTIGIVGSAIMLFYSDGFSYTPLESVGIGYRIGVFVVLLMWIAKFLLKLLQNIDTGHSPIVPEDERTFFTNILEFVIGVCFIGLVFIPFYNVWSTDLLVILLVVISAVGVSITGICLTMGGAFVIIPALIPKLVGIKEHLSSIIRDT